MMRVRRLSLRNALVGALLWTLLLACGDTGQTRVQVPLAGVGTAPRPVTIADATVTLRRADVSFGPVYFCASEAGRAELCSVALAELRDAVVIHALDPTPEPLGALDGTSGAVRSAIFDYGIVWLLTENQPRALATAVEGHSAVLEGDIVRGAQTLRFRALVDIPPRVRGDQAVNAQRTSHTIDEDGARLTAAVDPHPWVERLDVDALFAMDTDGDGALDIDPSSPSYESIVQGMVSRRPVWFVWQAL
jgi:hypothetical protein